MGMRSVSYSPSSKQSDNSRFAYNPLHTVDIDRNLKDIKDINDFYSKIPNSPKANVKNNSFTHNKIINNNNINHNNANTNNLPLPMVKKIEANMELKERMKTMSELNRTDYYVNVKDINRGVSAKSTSKLNKPGHDNEVVVKNHNFSRSFLNTEPNNSLSDELKKDLKELVKEEEPKRERGVSKEVLDSNNAYINPMNVFNTNSNNNHNQNNIGNNPSNNSNLNNLNMINNMSSQYTPNSNANNNSNTNANTYNSPHENINSAKSINSYKEQKKEIFGTVYNTFIAKIQEFNALGKLKDKRSMLEVIYQSFENLSRIDNLFKSLSEIVKPFCSENTIESNEIQNLKLKNEKLKEENLKSRAEIIRKENLFKSYQEKITILENSLMSRSHQFM